MHGVAVVGDRAKLSGQVGRPLCMPGAAAPRASVVIWESMAYQCMLLLMLPVCGGVSPSAISQRAWRLAM